MTDMSKITPFYYSLSGNTEEDKKLLEPVEHVWQYIKTHPYTKLTSAFNYWLKISPDKLRQIDEIINILFCVCILICEKYERLSNWTLDLILPVNKYSLREIQPTQIDDVQDNAIWRDNIPVAQSIYGSCNTINAANYVQLIAFEKVMNLHPAAVEILIESLLLWNRGQGFDMYWKHNFICPTEKEYEIMAVKKVTWSIYLMVNLMKLFSTYEEDLSSLINLQGLHYVIHNDYSNFCEKSDHKNYCDDITEGKFNFLIVHALTRNPENRQLINILKQRTTDINMKQYCVKLLEKFGSFKYTREVLKKLNMKIKTEIERLGGNPILLAVLNDSRLKC